MSHRYENALNLAQEMLDRNDDSLGIRSALKEAGIHYGIDYGDDMLKFVEWAEQEMGISK